MNRFWIGLILLATAAYPLPAQAVEPIAAFTPGARILFQGDSITDGNRGRSADPNHILGHGYVFITAARHGAAFPERKLDFINRGVSGNTVLELENRWQKDTLNLKPDVLSILIGVNDDGRGIPLEQYEQVYDKLLTQAKTANPEIKLVLCEPFVEANGQDQREPSQTAGNCRAACQEAWRGLGAVSAHLRRGGNACPGRLLDLGQCPSDLSRPSAYGRRMGARGPRLLEMR